MYGWLEDVCDLCGREDSQAKDCQACNPPVNDDELAFTHNDGEEDYER